MSEDDYIPETKLSMQTQMKLGAEETGEIINIRYLQRNNFPEK